MLLVCYPYHNECFPNSRSATSRISERHEHPEVNLNIEALTRCSDVAGRV